MTETIRQIFFVLEWGLIQERLILCTVIILGTIYIEIWPSTLYNLAWRNWRCWWPAAPICTPPPLRKALSGYISDLGLVKGGGLQHDPLSRESTRGLHPNCSRSPKTLSLHQTFKSIHKLLILVTIKWYVWLNGGGFGSKHFFSLSISDGTVMV